MSDLRKAAEMALEAFEILDNRGGLGLDVHKYIRTKIEALRQALAQEPSKQFHDWAVAEHQKALALAQPEQKKEWVEITKGECDELFRAASDHIEYAWAVEAKLKEKNT